MNVINLEGKDIVTIFISSLALLVSLTTFFFNFIQKRIDNKRLLRKELTDVIKEIVEANITIAKLNQEAKGSSNSSVDLARSFNQRRRYLIERASFLMKDIPDLITHVDFNSIGQACHASGLFDKAGFYFSQSINAAPLNVELIFSLRGYARFLYQDSKIDAGRQQFEDAIYKLKENTLELSEGVRVRELVDTLLWYARAENDIYNRDLSEQLFLEAESAAELSKSANLWMDMQTMLKANQFLNESSVQSYNNIDQSIEFVSNT